MTTSIENPSPTPRLVDLGWDAGFAHPGDGLPGGWVPGRVIAQHLGAYRVAGPDDDVSAVLAGRFRHERTRRTEYPVVGDWVALAAARAGETATIVSVLPRRTSFRRRRPGAAAGAQVLAANVDLALIAAALSELPNLRRLERTLALAWESGATPLVVLTKLDLCSDPEAAVARARSVSPGSDVVAVSAHQGIGLDGLLAHLRPRRTAVILGPSGVGKSTLINALLGEERLRTRAVRKDGKGRHATTHRELVRLRNGALLIDTPGLREVGLWAAADGMRSAFEEIDTLSRAWRFGDCRHREEPGCAVRAAVEAGFLDPNRLLGWFRLGLELNYLERRRDPAASAEERARVKAANRAFRRHVRRKRGP